ncbi:MAG TPA: sensor domain-containing diguanylate cyclase, partial [Herpetosiphonaceae bacterium]
MAGESSAAREGWLRRVAAAPSWLIGLALAALTVDIALRLSEWLPGGAPAAGHGHVHGAAPSAALGWLVVGADGLTALSYVLIAGSLAYVVYRTRADIPFHGMFLAFSAFIVACGMTHLMAVLTIWWRLGALASAVAVATAVISLLTALALPPLLPKILGLIESARQAKAYQRELADANAALEREVGEHRQTLGDLQMHSLLLHLMGEGVSLTQADGGAIIYANPACETLLGMAPTTLTGQQLARFYGTSAVPLSAHGVEVWFEAALRRSDGSEFWAQVRRSQFAHPAYGEVWIDVYSDITQRKATEETLRRDALRDGLTGLPNRAGLTAELGEALESGAPLSLLFFDLDHFKRINDTLGHLTGDQLLRELAERLREGLRPGDSVARFGGDEFVAVLIGVAGAAEAEARAAAFHQALLPPFLLGGARVSCTTSIGVAVVGPGFPSAEGLIAAADAALYQAKAAGRG